MLLIAYPAEKLLLLVNRRNHGLIEHAPRGGGFAREAPIAGREFSGNLPTLPGHLMTSLGQAAPPEDMDERRLRQNRTPIASGWNPLQSSIGSLPNVDGLL